jgi:hypothetical protein
MHTTRFLVGRFAVAAALLFLASTAYAGVKAGIMCDFEGSADGWKGAEGISETPKSVDTWASHGKGSLKANIEIKAGGKYYVALTRDQNFTGMKKLTVDVKGDASGTLPEPLTAKLAIKVTDAWKWTDSGAQPVSADKPTTLVLDLTKIASIDSVKEIGVEFYAKGGSGKSAFYIDNVAIE